MNWLIVSDLNMCRINNSFSVLNQTLGNVMFLFLPQHNMPFWRISSHSDLMALHHALDLEYL